MTCRIESNLAEMLTAPIRPHRGKDVFIIPGTL